MLIHRRGPAAFLLALLAAATVSVPATAQDPNATTIVTVDGTEITGRDVSLAAEMLSSQLRSVPEQMRAQVLVEFLIDQVLLSGEAKAKGVEGTEAYRQRQAYFTRQMLRDSYVETVLADEIADADIAARYEVEIAKLPEEEEYRARHILVETEEEAEAVAEAARGGADFAELAAEKSTGPSASSGGDLGYFTSERMVPEFSATAAELDIGGISDPVKTRFGWHVIKLEDKRIKPPPALETVSDGLKRLILRDRVQEKAKALREAAAIDFPGAETDGGGADSTTSE